MRPRAAAWRLAITGAVALVLLILVANTITQPVATKTRAYTAEFTDASGLHLGADVRVRGVRVGKVQSLVLKRHNGQSVAAVGFTLDNQYAVVPATRLAIRYQALTGSRYVDVVNPSETDTPVNLVAQVPTAMTTPSFDITALFNGLQPVLATLSPDELNTFTANAASFLAGDGGGLAPMLDSIRKLTAFTSDREQVVATLMRNLSTLAGAVSGHSQDLIQILKWANIPIDATLTVLDEFRKSDLYGPVFDSAVVKLLANAGFKLGADQTDVDAALDRAITNFDDFTEAVKLVPVMWDNVPPPPEAGAPLPCSRGRAQLPEQMDVLLNGRRVVLCNP
jgi:phospholipid/cholesterol/gamma-HCH transport system substrate-binding protein